MSRRRRASSWTILGLAVVAGGLGWRAIQSPGIVRAQQASPAPAPQEQTPPQQGATPGTAATQPAPTSAAPQVQTPASGAIKAETREVRVDVVVTDKKGNYVQDLTTNDFRVFEDDKQQPINSFSFGADPNAPIDAKRHYMVLFFDNSSMDLGDQPRARAAAGKFIDAYAGPDRVMAIVNFGGTLQFAQNFTMDATRLKQAVSGISSSAVSPNASASNGGNIASSPGSAINTNLPTAGLQTGLPSLGNAEGDFGAYTLLLSLRQLAKSLTPIPGRKSLILFTAGFELNSERFSELTATIDACNKANVAIYPLDVRGLVAPMARMLRDGTQQTWASEQSSGSSWNAAGSSDASMHAAPVSATTHSSQAGFQLAAYHPAAVAFVAEPQHGGGGGTGGGAGGGHGGTGGGTGGGAGGGTGGGTGGGKGGTGGGTGGTGGGKGGTGGGTGTGRPGVGSPYSNSPYNSARQIVPQFPPSASTNQQVMYALATGTGGFPILNTNDLMSGLEKIAREQSEYYLLGYTPAESPAGSCHTLKVKVERGGTNVRARSGFCNIVSNDMLAGKPIEKEMESRASLAGAPAGTAAASATAAVGAAGAGSLEAPFFYTAPNEARVHLAMQVPTASIDCPKVKGKYHADVNVLGIAYRADGTVASRFSDEVTLDMEKDQWEKFTKTPMPYQNQFSLAPGQYRLSVVVSGGGDKFAKFEVPLAVDPYDGKKFSLSAVALSNQIQPVSEMGSTLDADLLADRAPLVVRNLEITPSADNHFKKTDKVAVYAQIYAPQLADANPPTVKCTYIIIDPKTGKTLGSVAGIDLATYIQKGNAVIPVALKLPVENFPAGEYLLKIQASQSDGALTQIRSVNFAVE
jgi:VWFA-related protein